MGRFRGIGANAIGALLGTVTPFCSCSSIPIFMSFTRAKLPLGVTFSFLISSPMVDLGSLMLLISIFGIKIAAAYVIFGLVIAVAGGTLIEKLHMENQVADFIRNSNSSIDVEAQDLIQKVLGEGNPFGVIMATIVGAPMYADIFGTIPVAEALLGKGAMLGTVLSFMMAVTTLSLPSMVMLGKAIKPKLLATFALVCVVGIMIIGYAFNMFQFLFI
ncbi:MAG: permease [Mogibacterium sp.]|nr:permease [Mogibacterium sp.]